MNAKLSKLIGIFTIALALTFYSNGFAKAEEGASCCSKKEPVTQAETTKNSGCDGCASKAGSGKRGGNRAVMQSAHTLVFNNGDLRREVIEIPGGVRTVNTTTNPDLVATLQTHPREMVEHLANGGHVRKWDPVFAEIAKYHDKITMTYKNLENGIEVTSTSDDENATALIRAHAYKVSEFVARGRDAMHEATPLPEGYTAKTDASAHDHGQKTAKEEGKREKSCH